MACVLTGCECSCCSYAAHTDRRLLPKILSAPDMWGAAARELDCLQADCLLSSLWCALALRPLLVVGVPENGRKSHIREHTFMYRDNFCRSHKKVVAMESPRLEPQDNELLVWL